jgi:hypothetical protein
MPIEKETNHACAPMQKLRGSVFFRHILSFNQVGSVGEFDPIEGGLKSQRREG